jgi:general secretion pathway protein M
LHRHYDESIARLSRQVSNQTAFNAQRPRLMEKLAALKLRDVRKMYLKGTSSALALAELQETVRTTIDTNGGRVISAVQGNVAKEEGAFRPVTANFTLSVNNANLRRVLYALETKEPYLFIETVGIQPNVGAAFRPVAGTIEPDMNVQLEVRGYALRAASESPPNVMQPGSNVDKARNTDSATKDKGGAS